MLDSDSASRAEVASSRIKRHGFFMIARAKERRCRCPPDNLTPRSPISVSRPFGNVSINDNMFACLQASVMRSLETFSCPHVRLLRMDSLNKKVSWETRVIY